MKDIDIFATSPLILKFFIVPACECSNHAKLGVQFSVSFLPHMFSHNLLFGFCWYVI